ncbi:hypothetical protein BJX64DRAFT_282718 [Aspergillus heterothallicus]
MSKNIDQKRSSRKRQPLEVLQGSPPKKIATKSPFGEWRVPKHNLLCPATLVVPDSPSPSARAATPLKLPVKLSLKPSATTRSPLRPIGSRRAVSMATQSFNYHYDAQPQFASSYGHRDHGYEIASDQELASSQPVSLIQLYRKTTSSRNKASRNSRAFLANNTEYMEEEAGHGPCSQYPKTGEYILSKESGHLTPPPRFVSQEYPWQRSGTRTEVGQEQSWHHDYQTQRNPLGFASYDNASQSRNDSSMSESPFLKQLDQSLPNGESWPVEAVPVSQTMQTPNKYMASSSLQLYRDSFDQPQDRSPYESFRLKRRNNRTDFPSITSGLQYGHPPDTTGNATIRSEPTAATDCRARPPSFYESLEETKTRLSARKWRDFSGLPKVSATHSRLSSRTSISQRTIKEEIYAILDNLTLGPNAGSQLTSSPQDNESPKTTSATSDGKQEPSNGQSPGSPEIEIHSKHGIGLRDEASEELNEALAAQAVETEQDLPMFLGEADEQKINKYYRTDCLKFGRRPGGILKSPPGLSRQPDTEHPVLCETKAWSPEADKRSRTDNQGKDSYIYPSAAVQRRLEVDNWFHTDNRGEEMLRRHIATIADNYVESRERLKKEKFSKQDDITAKQLVKTVGGVFANLHSYTPQDPKDPARYFANFRPVDSRYCGSPVGGQRSYFDWSATLDSWEGMDGGASLDGGTDVQ